MSRGGTTGGLRRVRARAHIPDRCSLPPRGPAMQMPREPRPGRGLVVPLGSRRCTAPDDVGWKAARLGRLLQENARNEGSFRVAAGVVVTSAALLEHCARNRIRTDDEPQAVAEGIRRGEVAPRLIAMLELAGMHLGGGP